MAKNQSPFYLPTMIVTGLGFAFLVVLLVMTSVQYDGFPFDRPVDLEPKSDPGVTEYGGWDLPNQRLRYGASVIGLVAVMATGVVVHKNVVAALYPLAGVLFFVSWCLFAALIMDSLDVADARDHYCDITNVDCDPTQYVVTCVFDALSFVGAVAMMILLVLMKRGPRQQRTPSIMDDEEAHGMMPLAAAGASSSNGALSKKERKQQEARRALSRTRALVGITVNDTLADGVVVTHVNPGGPGDRAGLREDDIIILVGDADADSLDTIMAHAFPGETEVFTVVRGDKEKDISVTYGGRDADGNTLSRKELKSLRKNAGKDWVKGQEDRRKHGQSVPALS